MRIINSIQLDNKASQPTTPNPRVASSTLQWISLKMTSMSHNNNNKTSSPLMPSTISTTKREAKLLKNKKHHQIKAMLKLNFLKTMRHSSLPRPSQLQTNKRKRLLKRNTLNHNTPSKMPTTRSNLRNEVSRWKLSKAKSVYQNRM